MHFFRETPAHLAMQGEKVSAVLGKEKEICGPQPAAL